LLRDDPRNASIICQAKIDALKITRAAFVKLGLNEKLEFARKVAERVQESSPMFTTW